MPRVCPVVLHVRSYFKTREMFSDATRLPREVLRLLLLAKNVSLLRNSLRSLCVLSVSALKHVARPLTTELPRFLIEPDKRFEITSLRYLRTGVKRLHDFAQSALKAVASLLF